MLPRGSFLVHGGYNVLALDLRGHGESAAQYATPGYLEARDILGAVRYVRSLGETKPIVLLGISYGAVASLLAAGRSQEIAAVIADGAYPTGKDVYENINRHFVGDNGTKPWLRALFLVASCPGIPWAASLVYYAHRNLPRIRLCLCHAICIANQGSRSTDIRRAGLDCTNRTDANHSGGTAHRA
jgi:pimeloyl-ACP methyl ester carboxylesterase